MPWDSDIVTSLLVIFLPSFLGGRPDCWFVRMAAVPNGSSPTPLSVSQLAGVEPGCHTS